jgi:hypothetical protein
LLQAVEDPQEAQADVGRRGAQARPVAAVGNDEAVVIGLLLGGDVFAEVSDRLGALQVPGIADPLEETAAGKRMP